MIDILHKIAMLLKNNLKSNIGILTPSETMMTLSCMKIRKRKISNA